MRSLQILRFLSVLLLALNLSATAQELDLQPDTAAEPEVENLYDRLDEQSETQYRRNTKQVKSSSQGQKPVTMDTLSDLAKLQAFEDIAVIQKKYLPKTERFEISALGFTNVNNPFFNNLGGGVKFTYHFSEKWGVEGIGNWFGVAARQVTEDLEKKALVSAANTVTARSFMGAAVKWSPIYGKVSLLNKSIVPFDLSFSAGGGLTKTDEAGGEPTVHLSTSQGFAISQSWAFRWDIMWNLYQAKATSASGASVKIAQNDLFLGIGVSLYIPEAGYR